MKLKIDSLCKSFKTGTTTLVVLNGITVEFDQGSTYAITGISGTGKSTFLQLLAGLDKPKSGAIYCDEKNISLYSAADLEYFHNNVIGLVFQNPYLIQELSVYENVMLPGLIGGKNKKVCKERAEFLLDVVGILDKMQEKPAALSGGQQQRVALARALFNKPTFLIADEPTGNLDEKTGHQIIDLLISLQKKWNMGLIISSHDSYVSESMEYVYQLKEGNLHVVTSKMKYPAAGCEVFRKLQ